MRADAKRNYDRIVEVAREVFREQGYDASLDEIAKRAGVGPGTLYRHFPKRENLLDAVMQSWVDRVRETTDKALAYEGADRDLLLNWFEEYVALISQHKGGPAKITSAMGDPDSPDHHQVPGADRPPTTGSSSGSARTGRCATGVETIQVCRLVGRHRDRRRPGRPRRRTPYARCSRSSPTVS